MKRAAVLFALAASVAACTPRPPVVGAAPPGISYRFHGNDSADSDRRADRYCGQYGKQAHLTRVDHDGADNIAVYACS